MTKSELSPWGVRLGALALLLSVFAAGAVTGAALYRWARLDACADGGLPPPNLPWGMLRGLDLTEEQRTLVQAVFERYKPKLDAVLRETFPKVRAVQEQIDSDIAKLLTDDQRRKFEAIQKHHGPPRGGPPMGPPGGPEGFGPHGPEPFGPGERMPPPPNAPASAPSVK